MAEDNIVINNEQLCNGRKFDFFRRNELQLHCERWKRGVYIRPTMSECVGMTRPPRAYRDPAPQSPHDHCNCRTISAPKTLENLFLTWSHQLLSFWWKDLDGSKKETTCFFTLSLSQQPFDYGAIFTSRGSIYTFRGV